MPLAVVLSPSPEWFNSSASAAAMTGMKSIAQNLNALSSVGLEIDASVSESGPIAARPAEPTLIVEVVLAGAEGKGKKSNPANYDIRVALNASNPSGSALEATKSILELLVVRNNTFLSTRAKLYKGQTSETVFTEKPVGFLEAIRDGAAGVSGNSVAPPDAEEVGETKKTDKKNEDGSLFGAIKGARNNALSTIASAANSVSSVASDVADEKGSGLYVPRTIPKFTADELAYLCSGGANDARFQRTAQFTVEKFIGLPRTVSIDVDKLRDKAASILPDMPGVVGDVASAAADAAPAAIGDAFKFGAGLLNKAADQASKVKETVASTVGVTTYKTSYVDVLPDDKLKAAASKLPSEIAAYLSTVQYALNEPLPARHGEDLEAPSAVQLATCVDAAYATSKWSGAKAGAGSTSPTAGTEGFVPCAGCPAGPLLPTPNLKNAKAAIADFGAILSHGKNVRVLEQYHGATWGRFDLASQLLPGLVGLASTHELINQKLVITVVSNRADGMANLAAFLRNGPKDINVHAFYPTAGYDGALNTIQQWQLGDIKAKSFGRLELVPLDCSAAHCQQIVNKIYEDRALIASRVVKEVQELYPQDFIKEEKPVAPAPATKAEPAKKKGLFDTIGDAVADEVSDTANSLKKDVISSVNENMKGLQDTISEHTGINIANIIATPKPLFAPIDAQSWGSIFPLVISYVQAYVDLVSNGDNRIAPNGKFDVVVPVGDLSNVLAAYIAREMGIPIRRIVVAGDETPEGKALMGFITTGTYDAASLFSGENAVQCIMAQNSTANLERLLFFVTGKDSNEVRTMMDKLQSNRCFSVPSAIFESKIKNTISGFSTDATKTKAVMSGVFEASGQSRVLHPSTCMSVAAADAYLKKIGSWNESKQKSLDENPEADLSIYDAIAMVVVSDLHWALVPNDVMTYTGLRLISHKDAGMVTPPGHEEPEPGCFSCCAAEVKTEKPPEPLNKVMQRQYASIAKLAPKVQAVPPSLLSLVSAGPVNPLAGTAPVAGGTVPAGPPPAAEPIIDTIVAYCVKNSPEAKEAAAKK